MPNYYLIRRPHPGVTGDLATFEWGDTALGAVHRAFEGYPPEDATAVVATPEQVVTAAIVKIRHRAEGAHPGQWFTVWESCDCDYCTHPDWVTGIRFDTNALTGEPVIDGRHFDHEGSMEVKTETIRHMALWSTGPALAVAAWLETVVENPPHEALEVAYEILRRPAPRTTAA
jgi:hypothetical protein